MSHCSLWLWQAKGLVVVVVVDWALAIHRGILRELLLKTGLVSMASLS